jgi:hypothetical protein
MKKSIKNFLFISIILILIVIYFFNYKEGNGVICKDKDEDGCNKNDSYCEWHIDQERVCNEEVRSDDKIICKKWTMVNRSKCINKN